MKCCIQYNRGCFVYGNGLQFVVIFLDENDEEIDISTYDSIDYYLTQGDEEIHATLGDGLSVISTGRLQIAITKTEMAVFENAKIEHRLDVSEIADIPISQFTGYISAGKGCCSGDCVVKPSENVVLKFYNVIAGDFSYTSYYNSLTPYASDELAIIGGLSVGDKYRTTDNHVSLPGGVIKTIMTT